MKNVRYLRPDFQKLDIFNYHRYLSNENPLKNIGLNGQNLCQSKTLHREFLSIKIF